MWLYFIAQSKLYSPPILMTPWNQYKTLYVLSSRLIFVSPPFFCNINPITLNKYTEHKIGLEEAYHFFRMTLTLDWHSTASKSSLDTDKPYYSYLAKK